MEDQKHFTENPQDELTLRDLLNNIWRYWDEIWNKRFLVAIITALFIAFFVIRGILAPVEFTGKVTFMVNEDEGGGGGIAGILGQFGLGGSRSEFNLPKIMELSRSRKIIQQAIFKKATIKEKNDYIANHIIDIYDYHENWEDSEIGLQNFYFEHARLDSFSRKENAAFQAIVSKVVGRPEDGVEGLLISSYSDITAIMNLNVKSESEKLSYDLVNHLYDALSEFYVVKSVEKQQSTLNIVQAKVDSLESLLNVKQAQILKFQDSNKALSLRRHEYKRLTLEKDIQILSIAYGEAIKNLEIADFSFRNATPFFQVIDNPIVPLKPIKEGILRNIILGGLVGSFLAGLFLIGRLIYSDINNYEVK